MQRGGPEAGDAPPEIATLSPASKGRTVAPDRNLPKSLDAEGVRRLPALARHEDPVDDRPEGWTSGSTTRTISSRRATSSRAYIRQPDDPRYRSASRTAEEIRRSEKELEKKFRKNYRDAADLWGYPSFRQRPLTTAMIAACMVVFILQNLAAIQR